jgi:integrase
VRRSAVVDKHDDARALLLAREHEVELIKRGLAAPRTLDKTFAELCDYWLTTRAGRKRSIDTDESMIRRHLRPFFGHMKLMAITLEQVDRYRATLGSLSLKTQVNHLTLIISLLNEAKNLGWLAVLPRIKKPRVRVFSQDFAFLRTADEVQRFLSAAAEEGDHIHSLYATAVFTGMRLGELSGLHWSDIDFDRRLSSVH